MTDHRPEDRPAVRPSTPGRPALDASEPSGGRSSTPAPTRPDDAEPTALRIGVTVALWAMSIVATWLASSGQLGFADWANIHGPNRYGVPAILELFAVVVLLLGYRQGRRRRSPYPLWLLAAIVGGFAVYTNVAHAGPRAGLVYGAASAVALLAWFVKLRLDLTHYLERVGHIPPARPKFGMLALVSPRLAWHGWRIAVRRRITTTDEMATLAEVFVAILDDAKAANIGRRLAVRTAWRTAYEMSGGPTVPLPHSAEVATVAMTVRPPEPVRAEEPPGTVQDRPDGFGERPVHPSTLAPSTRPRRVVTHRPNGPRLVWSPTVRANAKALRDRYGSDLPSSVRRVRDDMGWSNDKAKPAVEAYLAGADRSDEDEEGERAV